MYPFSLRRLVLIGGLAAATVTGAVLPATAGASPSRPSSRDELAEQLDQGEDDRRCRRRQRRLLDPREGGQAGRPRRRTQGQGALHGVRCPPTRPSPRSPADQLNALLADKAKLTAVLTYHVLKGRVPSSSLKATQTVPTLEGGTITINVADGKATITDGQGNVSNIVTTDVKAKNGVIHVIDTVLLPPSS